MLKCLKLTYLVIISLFNAPRGYTCNETRRKDMPLSAISMNSAIAYKEFVLSLYHKLQYLKMQYQQTK